MRVAIFSDVHGNLTALEAVLADIKQQAPDLIFFAGDLCLSGARPSACLQRLRQENISPIYGNTDEEISKRPLLSDEVTLQSIVERNWTILETKKQVTNRPNSVRKASSHGRRTI
jgi:predicted phosphodiesterase